jgi:hypothetical protein
LGAQLANSAMGYKALIDQLQLSVIPHYRQSFVTSGERGRISIENNQEIHIYPKTYGVKHANDLFEQLEFALKYDGINLEILQAVFSGIDVLDVQNYVAGSPTSKYARLIWYLYEFLTDKQINAPKLARLKYVDILDPERYFTGSGIRSKRHYINNNLLGTKDFCPILRKTKMLLDQIANQYDVQAKTLAAQHDPQIIARASYYLYTKETMSSYEIEREKPSKDRVARFVSILQKASSIEKLTKDKLIELQNIIVDPRFKDSDYRITQNYVGENVDPYLQRIHYISPKPNDIEKLMTGLLYVLQEAINTKLNPVLLATIISFGFVFIHPFEDGNGRLHRFLIHYILTKMHFTPDGIIFPVSAVMLQRINEYDRILESFSRPLMELIKDYDLTNDGVLTVSSETSSYYKYIDYTQIAEYLFKCIQETLSEHFEREVIFLIKYDHTKLQIQQDIDMPDKLIDLFMKFVIQNNGKLAENKRKQYFNMLTDTEIQGLQAIVTDHMY